MPTLHDVLEGKSICICAGSGGVGKTTTSAAIAMGMAARGLKVCVLTIDPAKRLADSLGLRELGNEASRVEPELFEQHGIEMKGELWAMMLDAKATFAASPVGFMKTRSERPSMNWVRRFGASRKSSALRVGGVSRTSRSNSPSVCSSNSFSMAMYSWEPARALEIC